MIMSRLAQEGRMVAGFVSAKKEFLAPRESLQLRDYPEDEVIKLRYGIDLFGHFLKNFS